MVGVDAIPSSIIGTASPVTFVHTCDSGKDWHWCERATTVRDVLESLCSGDVRINKYPS